MSNRETISSLLVLIAIVGAIYFMFLPSLRLLDNVRHLLFMLGIGMILTYVPILLRTSSYFWTIFNVFASQATISTVVYDYKKVITFSDKLVVYLGVVIVIIGNIFVLINLANT